jgi:hypothetical protein
MSLIAHVVDEQETFRKRSVAGHNLRSRTLVRCIIPPPVLHGAHTSREVRYGRHRGFEWRWVGRDVRPYVRYQAAGLLCIHSANFVSLVNRRAAPFPPVMRDYVFREIASHAPAGVRP